MNVLLTSVGRRVALLRAFRRELAALHPAGGRLVATDLSALSAGFHEADVGYRVPRCTADEYVTTLLDIVRREKVKVLVPLIDTELEILARHRDVFLAEGCYPVVSDLEAVLVSRDKSRSAARFRELGFGAPRTFSPRELADLASIPYPVFLKPADGSGSVGAIPIADADELRYFLARTERPVVQSLETGDEYTVDAFADFAGRVRCVVPRRRLEIRAGESSKGRTVKDREIMNASARLVEALGVCRGCITLQCFRAPDGRIVFFEANLRFGGGYPLSHAAGANFPRWILRLVEGGEVPTFDDWQEDLVMLRYDDAVYVTGSQAT